MVTMSTDFQQKYPGTAYAVRGLRHVKSVKPHVFKAFMKSSGLNEKRASATLTLTFDPLELQLVPSVIVAEPYTIAGYANYSGVWNVIRLGPGFVQQYEALVNVNGVVVYGKYLEAQRNAKLLMESKLLHELVHWGRAMVSGRPSGDKKGEGEVGWGFENDAYGSHLVSSKLGLGQYIGDS